MAFRPETPRKTKWEILLVSEVAMLILVTLTLEDLEEVQEVEAAAVVVEEESISLILPSLVEEEEVAILPTNSKAQARIGEVLFRKSSQKLFKPPANRTSWSKRFVTTRS